MNTVEVKDTSEEIMVDIKAVKMKRLTLRRSKELAAKVKDIIAQLQEISDTESIITLPALVDAAFDYAEDLIPCVCSLNKEQALDLDYDQLEEIFERFKVKNKGFLKMLGWLGLDLTQTQNEEKTQQKALVTESERPINVA